MTANPKIRLLSDLGQGDKVLTPSGQYALVHGFCAGRVELRYCGDGEEVTLRPELLELIERAPKHALPKGFFRDVKLVKGEG